MLAAAETTAPTTGPAGNAADNAPWRSSASLHANTNEAAPARSEICNAVCIDHHVGRKPKASISTLLPRIVRGEAKSRFDGSSQRKEEGTAMESDDAPAADEIGTERGVAGATPPEPPRE